MAKLSELHCIRVPAGTPDLSENEIRLYQVETPLWVLLDDAGEKQIQRIFKFKNFSEALAFTNRVGELAEKEDHHPAILTEWGRVTVTWWTHTVHGLHKNDFIMAAKVDALI